MAPYVDTRPLGISLTTWYTSSKKLGASAVLMAFAFFKAAALVGIFLLRLAEFMNFFVKQHLFAGLWNSFVGIGTVPATMTATVSFCNMIGFCKYKITRRIRIIVYVFNQVHVHLINFLIAHLMLAAILC